MNKRIRKVLLPAVLATVMMQPATSHAFFFFFVPLSLFTPNDKKTIDELEAKRDWKGILDLAELRLQNDEKNPSWLYLAGYGLQNLRRYDEAIARYKQAIEIKPDYKEAQLNLGLCQMESGMLETAMRTFIELSAKAPEVWQVYNNLALIHVKKENPAEARVYLEQLRSRNLTVAQRLEESHIKPLETRLEQRRLAAEKEAEEQKQAEAERRERIAAEEKAKLVQVQYTPAPPAKPLEDRLKDLKQLYSKGLLTKEVYESKQRELLNQ